MSLYGITGVHINKNGHIDRARVQQIDGGNNSWIGQPGEYEAHEVANMIVMGEVVYSIFIIPGGTVHGPKFRNVVYDLGTEGIELEQDIEGRRAQDLVLF